MPKIKSKKIKKNRLIEGMAKCLCNMQMEKDLKIDEVCYIREIPNMEGHCVVLRNKKPPLIGYHLDRFELLPNEDI
jgi:hypothetical protein